MCSKDIDKTGKYKLIEHKENYVMDSDRCLPDWVKPHFPEPVSVTKQQPNKDRIINELCDTPLSDDAREAFFQGRNTGFNTYMTGMQPTLFEDGSLKVKLSRNCTENVTLEDVFVPSTMKSNKSIPYGPELYMPFSNSSNYSVTEPPVSQPLSGAYSSTTSSPVSTFSEVTLPNTTYSPSSGYQSSPNAHSTSPESNPLDLFSPQQLDDTDFDKLIDVLSSDPQIHTDHEPLKKSHNQNSSTFDAVIDELLVESLLNGGDTFPDLPVYDQPFYHNHNGN